MKVVEGIMISPGIAIGPVFLHSPDVLSVPSYDISAGQIPYEIERFQTARARAVQDIEVLLQRGKPEVGEMERKLLNSHLLMLNDPHFHEEVTQALRERKKNIEYVLREVEESLAKKLESSEDEYLRERSLDIRDIANRLLSHLLYRKRGSVLDIDKECILVAHNLLPSDVISMNREKIVGIATDFGGKTSHVAILARAFEIPAVLGLSEITAVVRNDEMIILDGNRGLVIVDPDETTLNEYITSRKAWQQHELQLLNLNELRAETRDGKLLQLESNIEVPDEIHSVLAHGADGIGLFRSEFLYIVPRKFPDEEEQLEAYNRVLEGMKPRSVTIRTLDLGGDKIIPGVIPGGESNPILGWRAVRFCLSKPEVFKSQLKALLRASIHGNLKIMFPMISGVEELDIILEILEESKEELRKNGQPFDESVPVGIMIEVPSAAFTSDILAKKVSFFSIGTNDLIQYMIAVDRENERIAYLYEPFHPGVLRLIKMVVDNAHNNGIPVGMCGEMAGDPFAAVILLGLGLDEYSMSAIGIPMIKRIIRSVTIAEAEELVGTIMEMKSSREIDEYVRAWMEERFDFIPQY
ncbi:MAG: phosphoenolpyruvate--protein phosphotransferase [Spirochaetaceae bacterium]|nr:MAG: phosphoenolpyruvate--protein phosphotransferase [Spirochaetaceae bacterium]